MVTYKHLDTVCAAQLKAWQSEYRRNMYVIVYDCGIVEIELGEDTFIDTNVSDTGKLLSYLRWHKIDHKRNVCHIDDCVCQHTEQAWGPEDGGICPCGGPACDGTCDR